MKGKTEEVAALALGARATELHGIFLLVQCVCARECVCVSVRVSAGKLFLVLAKSASCW